MPPSSFSRDLLDDPRALRRRVEDTLVAAMRQAGTSADDECAASSAVLFLLGNLPAYGGQRKPSLVLNKRSQRVKQPGDLCCPGGGISHRWDRALARMLGVPGMPLRRWAHYDDWRAGTWDREMPVIVAAALREAFEEMRLNPILTSFLGLLPPQSLYLRGRAIRPAVAWLHGPQLFRPNWEVDKIVVAPLETLLDPSRHARLRVHFAVGPHSAGSGEPREFPCVVLADSAGEEILWGATWRIASRFLSMVLGFVEPPLDTLPLRELTLDEGYLKGATDK